MPVQAQQQLPSLGELKSRTTPQLEAAPSFLISAPHNHLALMDDSQQQQQQQQFFVGADGMHRIISHGSSPLLPIQGLTLPNFAHMYSHAPVTAATMECVNVPTVVNALGGARKRRKESVSDIRRATPHAQPHQAHLQQLGVDLNQTLASSFPHQAGTLVSTGLRLAFDDDRSTVTSSRPSSTPACGASSLTLGDELAVQFSSHQEDLNQLLKAQAEQLRQALEERMKTQAKALMASVEGEVSRKIREKEAEMERVSRRNSELEERVRQLSMEREVWQSKAKNNEAMVAILRSNLQQAMVHHQSREPSRIEGCGDSEADDAASVYIDDNLPAQQSRAMMMRNHVMMKSSHMSTSSEVAAAAPGVVRACRRCGANEASVLVLPCLHLCLCLQCNQSYAAERCPVCNGLVSNSAEVFLS
ncbi:hypothetical protein GOP47_0002465 [Adiantum capillus-veneris]|uniref:RING-type domain-containing protein n=1 Tax=Adiantum capillus-veneris TaxID=13818 RepID=A0A9D4VC52_ADICA|nr:hypothetical protein GOP47_0002465 [Adiantum capillus-veneris]